MSDSQWYKPLLFNCEIKIIQHCLVENCLFSIARKTIRSARLLISERFAGYSCESDLEIEGHLKYNEDSYNLNILLQKRKVKISYC